jgi:hypothetical protein
VFALDALEGEEHAQVARYVERDEGARAEVLSLREAVALLPRSDVRAPASLWSTIEHSLGEPVEPDPPPLLRVGPVVAPAPRGRRRMPTKVLAGVLAAAAIVAIAILGVQVASQQNRIDDLAAEMHHGRLQQEAAAARASKDAHVVRLDAMSGAGGAEIVMMPDGTGYFMDHGLPALTGDATYQLWAKVGAASAPRMVSLAVLGADPDVAQFRVDPSARMFEITTEPASGSESPSESVVMRGVLT